MNTSPQSFKGPLMVRNTSPLNALYLMNNNWYALFYLEEDLVLTFQLFQASLSITLQVFLKIIGDNQRPLITLT